MSKSLSKGRYIRIPISISDKGCLAKREFEIRLGSITFYVTSWGTGGGATEGSDDDYLDSLKL